MQVQNGIPKDSLLKSEYYEILRLLGALFYYSGSKTENDTNKALCYTVKFQS